MAPFLTTARFCWSECKSNYPNFIFLNACDLQRTCVYNNATRVIINNVCKGECYILGCCVQRGGSVLTVSPHKKEGSGFDSQAWGPHIGPQDCLGFLQSLQLDVTWALFVIDWWWPVQGVYQPPNPFGSSSATLHLYPVDGSLLFVKVQNMILFQGGF